MAQGIVPIMALFSMIVAVMNMALLIILLSQLSSKIQSNFLSDWLKVLMY